MYNQKFGITNIAHNLYPHIHRIIALRDIGAEVHRGDLGGFVADESNLSYEPGDNSWVFGDAIAAGLSIVAQDSQLQDHAVACGEAYVSHGSVRLRHIEYACVILQGGKQYLKNFMRFLKRHISSKSC